MQILAVYNATDGSVVLDPFNFASFWGVVGAPYNGLSDTYCAPRPAALSLLGAADVL